MPTDASRAGKQNAPGEVVVEKTLGGWQQRNELQDTVVKSLPLGVNWRSIVLIFGFMGRPRHKNTYNYTVVMDKNTYNYTVVMVIEYEWELSRYLPRACILQVRNGDVAVLWWESRCWTRQGNIFTWRTCAR